MSASFSSTKRRLQSLRNWESANVLFVPAVILWLWSASNQPVNWSFRLPALVLVVYILIQGSIYWHLKLQVLAKRTELPRYFAPLFRFFRRSNVVAVAGMGLALVLVLLSGQASRADVAWWTGLTVFAVLEHVNYYVYQLMHDTRRDLKYLWRYRRLRRSALAEDLEAGLKATSAV